MQAVLATASTEVVYRFANVVPAEEPVKTLVNSLAPFFILRSEISFIAGINECGNFKGLLVKPCLLPSAWKPAMVANQRKVSFI